MVAVSPPRVWFLRLRRCFYGRAGAAELTLAPVTPGMEELIDASKVSESEAHVIAEQHGTVVARELTANAA